MLSERLTVMGVDPHAARPHAVAFRRYDGSSHWSVRDLVTIEFAAYLEQYLPDVVVAIEDQYMVRHTGLKKLIHAAGQIQGVCITLDVRWEMINPAKWQAYFGVPSKMKKEDRELAYLKQADNIIGPQIPDLTPDQAVAVLLSEYARCTLDTSL